MSNEEFEKKMEFILEQQAQFSADIQQLRELHAQAETRLTRLENIVLGLHEDTNTKFNALVDSQMRLMVAHERLAESQARTDERLNTFINVVERYITEGRNGKSESGNKDKS